MQIGNVDVAGNLVLAPMAGVTDMPFRLLCKEQGAALVYTEMISAKGVYYRNKNTERLWQTDKNEHPVALQLFGSDPDLMAEVAQRIEEQDFDILDINMGCPVPKVVNNGEGAALMRDARLAGQIVKAVSGAVKKPVTVKIRAGFACGEKNAPEFARVLEDNGAAAIAVHGRTREEYYNGRADWDVIAKVKAAVSIPVMASGDIFSGEDALRCARQTGCDAMLIGRGAQGNPWIFKQIDTYLSTGKHMEKPPIEEVVQMILKHGQMLIALKGQDIAMREMRKHVAWYTKGYRNAAAVRRAAGTISTYQELVSLCERLIILCEEGEERQWLR